MTAGRGPAALVDDTAREHHVEIVARAAICHDDAVLLCRARGHASSFLPGGHVEGGETLAAALARELAEEIDLVAAPLSIGAHVGVVEHAWIDDHDGDAPARERCEINHVFLVRAPRAFTAVAREPALSFAWRSLADLDDLLPAPMRALVRLAHAGVADVFGFESTRVAAAPTTVRALVPDDARRLRRARLFALAETPSAFGSTLAREKDRELSSWVAWATPEPDRVSLVADDGERFVGTATGKLGDGDTVELLGMWVHAAHRGTGVAARLVEAVAAWASSQGRRTLSLWVADDNARGRAFYRRAGFVETGEACDGPVIVGRAAPLVELRMTRALRG